MSETIVLDLVTYKYWSSRIDAFGVRWDTLVLVCFSTTKQGGCIASIGCGIN
jgi:hypothetical protein